MSDQPGNPGLPPGAGEDAFFVLRDCRELFQRRLADIARQSGINAPSVINAFTREIETAHDELASSTRQDGFEQTNGLTASRISLVGNDDLELEIRIGDIINRLKGNERIDRWRVQLRYMTLLDRPKMSAENNPAGLEPISRGLWAICRANNAGLDQNLDHLDRLEEQLQAGLPEVYAELNALLERRGIAPAQVRPVQRGAVGASAFDPVGTPSVAPTPANATSALQQRLMQQSGVGTRGADLAGSYASEVGLTPIAGNAALSATTLTMLNHLMERLTSLEQRQASAQPGGLPAGVANDAGSLRAVRAKDLDLPLGQPASIALDTLSMIFDAIFATPDLADVVKSILSRLQIPLLKVAILDDSFFSDTRHPARQIINLIARAAFGLAPDVGRDHPVCQQLAKVADAVRVALEKNAADLKPYLEALERLIAERDQAQQSASEPYMQLVVEHERRLSAQAHANAWLHERLAQCAEPTMQRFLSAYGLRMMHDAAAGGGIDGARWKECQTTIDELLWSIRPKQTPEERKRLVALVPTLLKRLNAELDALNVSADDRAPFLNACFDLQTAALRNRPDPSVQPTAAPHRPMPPASTPSPEPHAADSAGPEILERNGKLVQYFGAPTANRSAWRSGGIPAVAGNWLSFELPGEGRLCGRHCGQSAESGCILLFNSDWGYAVAMDRAQLEQQLVSGKARALSGTALFDEAAEQALKQIGQHTP